MKDSAKQFAHIFIHYYSNKATSTCKLFISEPTRSQEEKMGRLFGIIEINTPSKENSLIINQIINYLEEIFYGQYEEGDINQEKAFESSLESVNQRFSQLIREKKFYLVGNLNEITIKEKINLVVGVLKDNQVYLSYLNNMGLYLLHKGKQDYKVIDIAQIATDDKRTESAGNASEEGKIFTNFLNGDIKESDFLFVVNHSFLDYVTMERVKKIITSIPIHKAAEYFKNHLLQYEGYNFAAIIIKNSEAQVPDSKAIKSLTSITDLNYTENSTEKLLAPTILDGLNNAFRFIVKGFRKLTKKEIIPDHPEQQTQLFKLEEAKKQINLLPIIIWPLKKIARIGKKIFRKFFSTKPLLEAKLQNLGSVLRLKLAYLGNYLKKIPNLSKILLIIAVFLIILFVYSTSYFKHQQQQKTDSQEYLNIVTQIEDKKNQAESNIIFGDENKARQEIMEAQTLLETIEVNSQKQKERFEQLTNELEIVIAKLRKITTISDPVLITDLSTQQENNINIKNIVYNNNSIFAFDSLNNNTYQINIDDREVKKIYSNLSDIGKIVKVKIIDKKILVYHDKPGFVEFANDKFSPLEVILPTNSKIIDFVTYNGRLYTADTAANQIYRHPQSPNGYGPGITWLKEPFDLKNTVSMGIDTSIWLLDNQGQISKFTKGIKQSFSIKNLDPGLDSPNQLYTDDATKFIYILEQKNKRIIVLDKTGELKTQYYNNDFDNLKAFIIMENEKKIFVLNDNKIIFFNLTHL